MDERALGPGVGESCATSLCSDDTGLYISRLSDEQARDRAAKYLRNGADTVYSAERQVINEVGQLAGVVVLNHNMHQFIAERRKHS